MLTVDDGSPARLIENLRPVSVPKSDSRSVEGGRKWKMTPAKLRFVQAAMKQKKMVVSEICRELHVTRQTRYRHLSPDGKLRPDGERLLKTTQVT